MDVMSDVPRLARYGWVVLFCPFFCSFGDLARCFGVWELGYCPLDFWSLAFFCGLFSLGRRNSFFQGVNIRLTLADFCVFFSRFPVYPIPISIFHPFFLGSLSSGIAWWCRHPRNDPSIVEVKGVLYLGFFVTTDSTSIITLTSEYSTCITQTGC